MEKNMETTIMGYKGTDPSMPSFLANLRHWTEPAGSAQVGKTRIIKRVASYSFLLSSSYYDREP